MPMAPLHMPIHKKKKRRTAPSASSSFSLATVAPTPSAPSSSSSLSSPSPAPSSSVRKEPSSKFGPDFVSTPEGEFVFFFFSSHLSNTHLGPLCGGCGTLYVIKTARSSGRSFFGCPQYPKCQGRTITVDDWKKLHAENESRMFFFLKLQTSTNM